MGALILPVISPAQQPQQDSHAEKFNNLTVDANFMTRGELRYGGLPVVEGRAADHAKFVMERTRLGIGYERPHLEARINVQHSGVWGQAGKGAFNLFETWVKLKANNGLFAQLGRQELNYDDERILGRNDWAIAANSHDAIKLGYEGHGHKAHAILAYNQRAENINGGSTYRTNDGAHPYKSMIAAWYHYDLPTVPLGLSALFVNLGVQNKDDDEPKTEHQQLLGAYAKFHPERFTFEAAYYRQMGTDEFHIPIEAWMTSLKASFDPTPHWRITAGYDYLSGDNNPVVPTSDGIGLAFHDKVRGFSTLYGSHHQFYGAMDFFYIQGYYSGYTPGLQNVYVGATYKPIKALDLGASYHYLRAASALSEATKSLGHEVELTAGYNIIKDVKLSAGYSYMYGTSTLERLQRVDGNNNMHWAWLMITVNPRIFSLKW